MSLLAEVQTVTVGELLRRGTAQLAQAGIEEAAREAAWLLEHALDMTLLDLRVNESRPVGGEQLRRAQGVLARRAKREPLQYLLGTQEFCGLVFEVTPSVLIPRPETELLVEEAAFRVATHTKPVIADIGTGSGCIAVALAHRLPQAMLHAVDRSAEALRIARWNAERLEAAPKIAWYEGDLVAPLCASGLAGRVDVVVSNPPYIPERDWEALQPEVRVYEPRLALAAGEDGRTVYRRLVPEAAELLCPGGWLVLEVGQGQADAVRALIAATGRYGSVEIRTDAAGIERAVSAQKRWSMNDE